MARNVSEPPAMVDCSTCERSARTGRTWHIAVAEAGLISSAQHGNAVARKVTDLVIA